MEKEFIPYTEALALKELGFNEPCFGYRDGCGYLMIKPIPHCVISAPTFSQAFRFFREKYNFASEINVYSTSDGYSFSFKILCKKYTPYIEANNAWILYEEAELACIRKLIEIAKEQKKKRAKSKSAKQSRKINRK